MVEVIGPIQAKVHVICNGVDTSRYEQEVDRALIRQHLGLAAEARLIIVLATLKEQKGHRYPLRPGCLNAKISRPARYFGW
ncbi:MAG: hypothetical protein HS114_24915 [Anaerolineales bacterium]|nr:hypothetical protein [Anaerolineales bacterium]